ncbi:MAG: hypothetical protein ACR2LT_08765 [Pyrinomonadaceae bacterium]
MKNYKLQFPKILFVFGIFVMAALSIAAQSTSANYPTPVTSSEISGTIRARDVGDDRLTSYYYVFNGNQGDVFINVETTNLNGDIDIFAAEDLRSLTRIPLYADNPQSETGRIVYLRQPLKLILRVQGRTPDDNPATFQIKFAGSFATYQGGAETEASPLPEVKSKEKGEVRVNSVGTIIEPKKEETTAEKEKAAEAEQTERKSDIVVENPQTATNTEETGVKKKDESDNVKAVEEVSKTESGKTESTETEPSEKKSTANNKNKKANRKKNTKPVVSEPAETTQTTLPEIPPKNPPKNPLENVRLIVLMKNGDKFEYPMTEVFRFSLNNNILTVILKDGKIERRSIFDIQKFSVE